MNAFLVLSLEFPPQASPPPLVISQLLNSSRHLEGEVHDVLGCPGVLFPFSAMFYCFIVVMAVFLFS